MKATDLEVWHCPRCGTVLAKLKLTAGSLIEAKCPRCKTFTRLEKVEERVVAYR